MLNYDAIVLPGLGGPSEGEGEGVTESLPFWVRDRLNLLIERYQKEGQPQTPIVTLSAGSYHVAPVYDGMKRPISEATAMALYLRKHGNLLVNIYEENVSFDTIGNAFYLRAIHCEPRQWRKLLIMVNDFHVERLRLIFDWIFRLPPLSMMNSKEDAVTKPMTMMMTRCNYELDYWVIKTRLDHPVWLKMVESRSQRERVSYLNTERLIERLGRISWAEFHEWFFKEHDLYRMSNRENLLKGKYQIEIDDACRLSYGGSNLPPWPPC